MNYKLYRSKDNKINVDGSLNPYHTIILVNDMRDMGLLIYRPNHMNRIINKPWDFLNKEVFIEIKEDFKIIFDDSMTVRKRRNQFLISYYNNRNVYSIIRSNGMIFSPDNIISSNWSDPFNEIIFKSSG